MEGGIWERRSHLVGELFQKLGEFTWSHLRRSISPSQIRKSIQDTLFWDAVKKMPVTKEVIKEILWLAPFMKCMSRITLDELQCNGKLLLISLQLSALETMDIEAVSVLNHRICL